MVSSPSSNFSDSKGSFPVGRELPFTSSRIALHPPDEVSLQEAPQSDFGIVASCCSKLACCLPNFALVTKFVFQIEVDRQAFFIEGKVEHLPSDGRFTYLDQDHCLGSIRQTVWCLSRGCLGGASCCRWMKFLLCQALVCV